MRALLIGLVLGLILIAGCLRIESKNASPTPSVSPAPQIVYVNVTPSPVVIISIQPSVVPTVTEKIIYPSPSKIATPERRGGFRDLGERKEYVKLDISKAANSDNRHDPFRMRTASGEALYPKLQAGELKFGDVPFEIPPSYASTGKWNTITSADPEFYSANIILGRVRLSEVHFLLAGKIPAKDNVGLAEIRLNYEDGEIQPQNVIANTDAWNYEEGGMGSVAPPGRVAWAEEVNGSRRIISTLAISNKYPIKPLGAIAIKKGETEGFGIAIFAATGVKRFFEKMVTQTQTEFQLDPYRRDYSTALPEGAMINYDDSSGKRLYRPKGTLTAGIFDGEPDIEDARSQR